MNTITKELWNPFQSENHENPHPMYDRLRAEAPVHKNNIGNWILTKYDHVKVALQDPSRFIAGDIAQRVRILSPFFEKKGHDLEKIVELVCKWLLILNPPEHTRYRAVLQSVWDLKGMPQYIDSTVNEMINEMLQKGEADLIEEFAKPLPIRTVCKVLGLPEEDMALRRKWSYSLVVLFEPLPWLERYTEINTDAGDATEYFRELVRKRKAQPKDDLISRLIVAKDDQGNTLPENEVISCIALLLTAGQETTGNFLGGAIYALLQNPEQLKLIQENPELIKAGVEELVRYESPTQLSGGTNTQDVVLDGKLIPKGSIIFLAIAAANRDPAHFEEPHKLNLQRSRNNHLAFGTGTHHCLGKRLARTMSHIALSSLVTRIPDMQLMDEPVLRYPNIMVRGLQHVKVRYTPKPN